MDNLKLVLDGLGSSFERVAFARVYHGTGRRGFGRD